MDATIRILLVGGLGVFAILILGNSFRWWSEMSVSRLPGREKLLRSPGESMRRNLDQLDEYLIYSVALFLLVPIAFAWKTPDLNSIWPLTFLFCLMTLSALPCIYVVRLYRDYVLGLRAERAVGEELNQLMLDGCRVFHDYPSGPGWHINHIIVAPSGVYTVETKTSPKNRIPEADRQPDVLLDGTVLKFPSHTCEESVKQARRSAELLRKELSDALPEPVEVNSIVSLPGWRVLRRGECDVKVLNPKEIWQRIVTTAPPKLSNPEIERIAYYIQQKCRDVEI